MATLRGEALVATTGITVPLRPGPVRITLEVLRKAEGIERTIQRQMQRFVRAPGLADVPELPGWDYDEIMGLLPHAQDEARQVENVASFQDPDLAMEYAEALGTALGFVAKIAPAEIMPALVGAKRMAPGGLGLSEFRRAYAVIDKPLSLLDQLSAGCLVPDEVDALAEVYPGLYGMMKQALFTAMNEQGAVRPTWELPYDKDNALQIFLQTDTMNADLASQLSSAFEKARQDESGQTAGGQAAPRSPSDGKGIGDASTQQERLEAK